LKEPPSALPIAESDAIGHAVRRAPARAARDAAMHNGGDDQVQVQVGDRNVVDATLPGMTSVPHRS
jgi:hypothetical protein